MESYPRKYLCISLSQLIISFALGIMVASLFKFYFGIISGILGIASFLISMRFRCTTCFYYGKQCFNGFGLVVAKLFKQQPSDEFQNSKNVIITLVISMINTFFPIIIGIIDLILSFSGFKLAILLLYLVASFVPNFFIQPKMCVNCKQGELGCPAYKNIEK